MKLGVELSVNVLFFAISIWSLKYPQKMEGPVGCVTETVIKILIKQSRRDTKNAGRNARSGTTEQRML